MSPDKKIIILGAGVSGLTLAYHLKKNNCEILEKESVPGGLCRTLIARDFIFDLTGHWLSFKRKVALDFLVGLLRHNLQEIRRKGWIFLDGQYIKQPFQNHFFDLPLAKAMSALFDLMKAQSKKKALNEVYFHDYLKNYFGDSIARYFFIPYNRKLWKHYYGELIAQDIKKYVEGLNIDEVIRHYFLKKEQCVGYNSKFYYPRNSGIEELVSTIARRLSEKNIDLKVNHEVKYVDLKNKEVICANRYRKKYDLLVSTMPLPFLLKMMKGIPSAIKECGDRLSHINLFVYNLGINKVLLPDKHWIFFPEKKYIFHKIGFPSNISKHLSPAGTTSMYVYVSLGRKNNVNTRHLVDRIKTGLYGLGILRRRTDILVEAHRIIRPAYVVCDNFHQESVSKIKQYLFLHGIMLTGRFGSWRYSNLEGDILDAIHISKYIDENRS